MFCSCFQSHSIWNQYEKEVFNDIEIQKVWNAQNEPYADTLLILIYTGMRIQEMLNLTKFNIDLDKRIITGGLKTDSGKDRDIPINDKIYSMVRKYCDMAKERLFINAKGNPITQDYYRKYIFNALMEKLNIEGKTPHATRHTFATLLANASVDPNSIKNLIGHSDYAFTANVYTHSNIEVLRHAINKI